MATSKEYLSYILDQLSGLERMPDAALEPPYEGAKEMLLVEEVDDSAFLVSLFTAMYEELPAPKPKKRKKEIK